MALTDILEGAGHIPSSVETSAAVRLFAVEGGFEITRIDLTTRADVPGIDGDDFAKLADAAETWLRGAWPRSAVASLATVVLERLVLLWYFTRPLVLGAAAAWPASHVSVAAAVSTWLTVSTHPDGKTLLPPWGFGGAGVGVLTARGEFVTGLVCGFGKVLCRWNCVARSMGQVIGAKRSRLGR